MEYTQSLNLNKQFKTLYYRGKYKAHPMLVTYAKRNGLQKTARIGITTGKKIGNAVKRNRARRIIIAAYTQLEKKMDLHGWDFVFVAREGIGQATSTEIQEIMGKQLRFVMGDAAKTNKK